MGTPGFRLCPSCGSRNKPKWEACARCGELLGGVVVSKGGARSGRPARSAPIGPSPFSPLTVGAFVAAVLFFAQFHGYQPTVPAAEAFTIPTTPAEPAPAPEAPSPVGSSSFAKGRLALLQGDLAEAVRLLGEAVADAPGEALYHAYYARALWQSGARDQALREHDAAVRLNPASVDYLAERAASYMALGRSDDAALDYSRVLDAHPDNVPALRGLARLKQEGGDEAGAVSLLQRALRVRGTDPEIVQELAYALEKSGDFERARVQYANVLALMPDAQITRSRLAETLLAESRPDEAVRVLEEGVARTPSAPMLRRSLGSLLERTGKIQEAAASYRAYARLAPNAEDAKALQARAAALERRLGATAGATQEAPDTTTGG